MNQYDTCQLVQKWFLVCWGSYRVQVQFPVFKCSWCVYRLELYNKENTDLKRQVIQLETSNRLVEHMFTCHPYISSSPLNLPQKITTSCGCLMPGSDLISYITQVKNPHNNKTMSGIRVLLSLVRQGIDTWHKGCDTCKAIISVFVQTVDWFCGFCTLRCHGQR